MRLLSILLFLVSTALAQVPTGWVNIVNDKSNTCLDMSGGPKATGSGVQAQIWTCLGSNQTNQIFELVPVTGGYEITPENSGLALGSKGGSTVNETPIVQTTFNSSNAYQIWTITAATTNGYYTLHPASSSGSCVAASNGGTKNGTVVWQTGCNGLVQQEWKFVPITSVPAPTISSVSPNNGPTTGGTAVIVTGSNFTSPASVTFGGTAATNVLVSSSTQITANTPAGNAGPVGIGVNQGSQNATMANAFNYVPPATQTITFVQGNYSAPQGSTSTVAVPFTHAQAASDLNVVVVGWHDSTSKVNSVVDTFGNVYTLAGNTVLNGSASQSLYYAKNVLGAAAGTNTVTVTFSAAALTPDVQILEYAGADPTKPLDVYAGTSGNSAASSVSITTTFSGDIIVGANLVQSPTSGPGTGFTERILSSPNGDISEDMEATSVGNYTASAPLTAAGYWITGAAAFKLSSSTPPPPTYGISGTVTGSSTPVSMALSGPSSTTVTASGTGTYTFSGLSNGTYTVTPSENGYTFNPANATATVNNGSVTGLNFTAAAAPPPSVSLSWVASTSSNVVSYNVYRAPGTSTTYTQIATGDANLSYSDTSVAAGSAYSYVVTAVNSSGDESAYSNAVTATIPAS